MVLVGAQKLQKKKRITLLNNGDANPHGIIISPLQKGKPVYLPFHTFDREMMQHVFRTHGEKLMILLEILLFV